MCNYTVFFPRTREIKNRKIAITNAIKSVNVME